MNMRKLLRVLHRDFGYFFTGMTLIYCVTGILLNHTRDWNPYYSIDIRKVELNLPLDTSLINKELLTSKLESIGVQGLRSFYYPKPGTVKLFVSDGTVTSDLGSGSALVERSYRRPVLYQLNMLHKNLPKSWWTWFSDIFAIALMAITISGLFLVKGKNGITHRGVILIIAGLALPLVAIILL